MILTVHRSKELEAGTVAVAAGRLPSGRRGVLRLGTRTVEVRVAGKALPGRLELADDLWKALAVPYESIRLQARPNPAGELELGPTIAVLYAGSHKDLGPEGRRDVARFYYEPYRDYAGLLAIGFADSIDWDRSLMQGYVMDNRPGREGETVPALYPIPSVVRLTWAIPRETIRRLREATGERCFNWVRNIGKWQFHTLLSAVPELVPHLPETRLMKSIADLAAMLARHETVFVKDVFSIKGMGVLRIRTQSEEFEVRYTEDAQARRLMLPDLTAVWQFLKENMKPNRRIVQAAIPVTGLQGRALHYRVLLVRSPDGTWRCGHTVAHLAPDQNLVITNMYNGGAEVEPLGTLREHYGMTKAEARERHQAMIDLCITAARALEEPFHPLGILGFDVVVSTETHELFLIEANSVPGWCYGDEVDSANARSQIAYGLSLIDY